MFECEQPLDVFRVDRGPILLGVVYAVVRVLLPAVRVLHSTKPWGKRMMVLMPTGSSPFGRPSYHSPGDSRRAPLAGVTRMAQASAKPSIQMHVVLHCIVVGNHIIDHW